MDYKNNLMALLQGASNSTAATISGPVDAINWGLGKAGVPTSPYPVGGSDWLKKYGLTPDVPADNYLAGLLGEGIGNSLPFAATMKAMKSADLLRMLEAQNGKPIKGLLD